MYPHIATRDAAASTNATWLRSISERSFHFSKWSDVKACRAVFGQRGERAIFNGDILPAPAGEHRIVDCPGKVDVTSCISIDECGSLPDVALLISNDRV